MQTEQKKLLIIVGALSMGGAENMIYELVKFINQERYNVKVICYGKKQNNTLEDKVSKLCCVEYLGVTGRINLRVFKKVFSRIKAINPDIIHAHMGGVSFSIPWCTLHKVPLCITVHSKPQQAFSVINNYLIKIFKSVLNIKIVAVSKENLILIRNYYKLNDRNSEYINNGIDIERFYKSHHDKYTFINVARLDENKNQIAIIRAIDRIIKLGKNVDLILVGDGPCKEELMSEAKRLGIMGHILFTGIVSDPEKYYAISDVYVQSSFREALPLSVLEAMATGLPIIATNIGGLKDVVDGNGILIEAGDDEALFSAMVTILDSSKAEYESMAETSTNIVKSYSSVRMAEQYEQTYENLLNSKKRI